MEKSVPTPPKDTIHCLRVSFPKDDPKSAEYYGRMLSPLMEMSLPPESRSQPFHAETETFFLPDVLVSRASNSACHLDRHARTIARSASDDLMLVNYLGGAVRFSVGGGWHDVHMDLGAFLVFDLSRELHIRIETMRNIGVILSRRRLETLVPFLDDAHGLQFKPGALNAILLGLLEQVAAMGPRITISEARTVSDLITRTVAGAIGECLAENARQAGSPGLAPLPAIKAAIERRLEDPELSPSVLTEEFGLARSTLYRLFEPMGGVAAYIRERRLRLAFRLITGQQADKPRVSQLAFTLGFSHPSAFTRAFKEKYGLSPSEAATLSSHPEEVSAPFILTEEARPYLKHLV
ncbi:AraC family transcriptional regulator [Oryzibacter oryziterrae]|uniref:AraC family transcriptional regulator n=1 Tax=Oryzibacter oryziterrae TaxID=2766474 RepID=UPI001F3BC5B7|nr:AraC family transcriptional regulator [Oryzibacter oryziterrae]